MYKLREQGDNAQYGMTQTDADNGMYIQTLATRASPAWTRTCKRTLRATTGTSGR